MTTTKLLFVCSRNRWRSPTAKRLLDGVPGYQARSAGTAGTAEGARVRVSAGLIGWADVILCMEGRHAGRLRERFPEEIAGKRLVVLDIPDDFGFMDPELVALLRTALADHLRLPSSDP